MGDLATNGPEHPHCPDCLMLYDDEFTGTTVVVSQEGTDNYYCQNCDKVIEPGDITDIPWMEMVVDSYFPDVEKQIEEGTEEFNDDCSCYRCNRED